MGFVKEFKEFALKGNVIDLAVGVVIGAAFNKIVTSLVDDIIMPPIGYLTGGVDFTDKKLVLVPGDKAANIAEVSIRYGSFINVIIQFLIVALSIFLVVKLINSLRQKPEEAPPVPAAPTPTEQLLMDIRDELRAKNI